MKRVTNVKLAPFLDGPASSSWNGRSAGAPSQTDADLRQRGDQPSHVPFIAAVRDVQVITGIASAPQQFPPCHRSLRSSPRDLQRAQHGAPGDSSSFPGRQIPVDDPMLSSVGNWSPTLLQSSLVGKTSSRVNRSASRHLCRLGCCDHAMSIDVPASSRLGRQHQVLAPRIKSRAASASVRTVGDPRSCSITRDRGLSRAGTDRQALLAEAVPDSRFAQQYVRVSHSAKRASITISTYKRLPPITLAFGQREGNDEEDRWRRRLSFRSKTGSSSAASGSSRAVARRSRW